MSVLKNAALLASFLFLSSAPLLHSQALPAATAASHLVVGGMFSEFAPDYGSNTLLGAGFYVDLNVRRHWGGEAEGRFLRFNQQLDVHEDTYLIGPKYRLHFRNTEPYIKFLFGNGQFNFPDSFAHGGYAVWAPGGGIDIHLNRRFTARADYEYQRWTGFQGSSLTPHGFSFGIGYRVF